jgi:cyclic dehypoxanthinyl futalosine synthase
MKVDELLEKGICGEELSFEEGVFLYLKAPLSDLIYAANMRKEIIHPGNDVTWIIDRNVNITNVCFSQCKFCNFCVKPGSNNSYITTIKEYRKKIDELLELGGNQLLIQGGMHPDLGLSFYKELFVELKNLYKNLKLHALGPPEIVHLAKKEKKSYRFILNELIKSGLDSLPGAGAEILCDRVRKLISPGKATTQEWLDVMKEAHKIGIVTSATMMYGHLETKEERVEHLLKLRKLQSEKPKGSPGFLSFIPWPFMAENTILEKKYKLHTVKSAIEHIRIIAFSRLFLNNIKNLQPSSLTIGTELAKTCLHSGANDFGSIMIEENVVSKAGAENTLSVNVVKEAILEGGFNPVLRDQSFG